MQSFNVFVTDYLSYYEDVNDEAKNVSNGQESCIKLNVLPALNTTIVCTTIFTYKDWHGKSSVGS